MRNEKKNTIPFRPKLLWIHAMITSESHSCAVQGMGVYDRKRCRAWEWKNFQEYTGQPECDNQCLHQPEVLARLKRKDKGKKARI